MILVRHAPVNTLRKAFAALLLPALLIAPGPSALDPAPAAAAGNPASRLKVVALLPLSGPGISLGMYLRYGIEMGRRELSGSGGGPPVDVLYLDTKSEAEASVAAIKAVLARGRPDAVICALSAVSNAVLPILERAGILTIVTAMAAADPPKGAKEVVRAYPDSRAYVEPIANYMLLHFDNIATVYINDEFGQSNQRAFAKIVDDAGKTLSASESFEPQQNDTRAVILRILASSPDAVFVTGYGRAYVSVIKALREMAADMPVFSEANFGNPMVLGALGQAADGIVFNGTDLDLSVSSNKRAEEFRKLYHAEFMTDPYHVVGFARDSVMLLSEAARKAGGKPDKAAIISLSPFEGVMGSIPMDSDGRIRVTFHLIRREKGRSVPVES
ncbi:MAG: ABC transporter substrate-binding protein [candidate division NC10 bacterium]